MRVFANKGPPMAVLLGKLIAAQRTGHVTAGIPLGYLARLPACPRHRADRA